ncbi:hypothetical protein MOC16_gp093 [Klebsiella phage vB_KpM_FBKp24]|uniref:Uncharacterized protein n=1 Tax=Klebsiella phage vB_KpM_FBKp24 TaxID=2801834 RepID=A0A7U0GBG8_9CAUD|nr:hypothetical protein MOC16_gp093 [Klebsiella phage vB_KpM_FBKp24]QQV92105.1 hypothetical protein vBKpMFBKp24_320 [Klebsiella phage vB_KpM_FBKp24]
MQASSLLNGLKGINSNANQFNIALAQTVKETIEGIFTPGQVFVYAMHAISEKYQLEDISIVSDPDVQTYRVEGNVLHLNVDFNQPNALSYLTLTEGIGYYLSPETKFREEARQIGTNWVTSYSNELYKSFQTQVDQRTEIMSSIGREFYVLLKNAHPLVVDQYNDQESFVSDFVAEAVEAADFYAATRRGLLKVVFDDAKATAFADIYSAIRRSDNVGGQYTNPSSAEFMSGYLFECLGAVSN